MDIEKYPDYKNMDKQLEEEVRRRHEQEGIHDLENPNVLFSWEAPEFVPPKKDQRWYLYIGIILLAIAGYALYTNSPIMAITFILIGIVGYLYVHKEPRILKFKITTDGLQAGNELYEYEDIKSFWIFYEPGEIKVISLKTKSLLSPYVHIPIGDENPVKIRKILLGFVEEEKQKENFIDTLERLLRI